MTKKRISFYEKHLDKIRSGQKTQTRRVSDHILEIGDELIVEEDTSIVLEITNIKYERIGDISEEDGQKEGYSGRDEFLRGKWATDTIHTFGNRWVWVYEFRVKGATMKLKPLGNQIVATLPDKKEETTESGLVLPDSARNQIRTQDATVVAVGPGRILSSGNKSEIDVKVGDRILFRRNTETEVKLGDTKYIVVDADAILAIIED